MKTRYIAITLTLFFLLLPSIGVAQDYVQKSKLVKKQSDGRLIYTRDMDGFLIPDFSYAGYHNGEKDIPVVSVVKEISPVSGDNTAHIQSAIDEIGKRVKNEQGIRGALLLKSGKYEVKGTIEVKYDGVVIRGENETIIEATGNSPSERDVIILGTTASGSTTDHNYWFPVSGTKQNITDEIVPVGAFSFNVVNASGYNIGDAIVIHHPCTNEWVDAIDGGGSQDLDERWSEGQVPIYYYRYITAKTGNRITVDAPVYYTLNKSFSQAYIYKTSASFLSEIGIENLQIDIKGSGGSHAKNAVRFRSAENCWAKNVVVSGFSLSGFITESCTRTSIIGCQAINPIAPGGSGYKYNFNAYAFSQLILFQNCYAKGGRHNFISNGTATSSGIVFQHCTGDGALETSEGHRHWTQAMLFDNHKEINIDAGNAIVLGLYNRNKSGSGHGYGAVQSVLWNCDVTEETQGIICLHQPPTSQNYAIGCIAYLLSGDPGMASRRFPEGYIEAHNIPVTDIVSLYAEQLTDRKTYGKARLESAPGAIDEDIKGYIIRNNLIEEGFNTTSWASAGGGSSVEIDIKDVGKGYVKLHSDCAVNTTDNKGQRNGGFSLGYVNLNGQGSDKKGVTMELPEIPSCGTVTVKVKCNSNKTLILQKKAGGRWGTIAGKYTSAEGDYEVFTFTVNSTGPVTLRLNSETTSAFYIYDLIVTDFVKDENYVDPGEVDNDNAAFNGFIDFSTEPGIFKPVGDIDTHAFENSVRHGFTFSNVILDPGKKTLLYTGSAILQKVSVNAGMIEFPEVENAGNVTIVAVSENNSGKFNLEKETGGTWATVKEFSSDNGDNITEYSFDVDVNDKCKLRIVNNGNCHVEIFEVVVEAYSDEEEIIYQSKEIIHEQFNDMFNSNVAGWTDKDPGDYTFSIPVGTDFGSLKLANCSISVAASQSGSTSKGRVRLVDQSSTVEFPEIPSCGTVTLNVNAGSATGKSITLQKKSGNTWVDVSTFNLTDTPVSTVDYEMNSTAPVTLRLITKQAGAKNVYEVWITNYEPSTTGIEQFDSDEFKVQAIHYYNIRGQQLLDEPDSGFFIRKIRYENGSVKTDKVFK